MSRASPSNRADLSHESSNIGTVRPFFQGWRIVAWDGAGWCRGGEGCARMTS